MQRIIQCIILFSLLIGVGRPLFAEPVKRALIIAIGDYPDSLGWGKISSTNDVALIKQALEGQGFREQNITIVTDRQATKTGIVNSINTLIRAAGKGDIVVIHYSGHGQQISDDNGDEIDKLDETLVCWDAPAYYSKGYTGDKHLRDDEFGELITSLRLKIGTEGQILVFMDSCHSGTGTRGEKPAVKVRGGLDPLIIPEFESVTPGTSKEGEKGFGMNEAPAGTRGTGGGMAPMVLFAGASFSELNYETLDENGKGVGSLSYSITKVFTKMEEGMTYRTLFSKVHASMSTVAPRQTPMLEGDIDYQVFNGTVVKQEPYFSIKDILNEKEVRIDGGKIMNLTVGDILGLFPAGTSSITGVQPVMKGSIISTENFTSIVQFENDHNITNPLNYWMFIKEQNFENRKIGISIKPFADKTTENLIREELTGLSLITQDEINPELVICESAKKVLVKTAADDLVFEEIPISNPASIEQTTLAVKRYAQSKFIKNLQLDDPEYRVEIRFIPVKAKYENGKIKVMDTLDFSFYLKDDPVPTFTEKDQFMIEVTNSGNRSAYFNIIDIQPDGYINPVVPAPGKDGMEYIIKKGQTYTVPDILLDGFYQPYGTEVFKVFASKEPINLSPIITSKGVGTRGSSSPLEAILQDTYQNTRGPKVKVSSMPSESSGSTFEFIFRIGK
jgi:metacaspase-1